MHIYLNISRNINNLLNTPFFKTVNIKNYNIKLIKYNNFVILIFYCTFMTVVKGSWSWNPLFLHLINLKIEFCIWPKGQRERNTCWWELEKDETSEGGVNTVNLVREFNFFSKGRSKSKNWVFHMREIFQGNLYRQLLFLFPCFIQWFTLKLCKLFLIFFFI